MAEPGEEKISKEDFELLQQVKKEMKDYNPLRRREPPKISLFSGSNSKNETTYDLWRYEVRSLMSNKLYEPDSIDYAVRRSLKGEAGRVAMHLGPKASLPEILNKLDSIYGDVEKKVDLLGDFFNARQREDENVTSWSCRLEDMIGKAVTRGLIHKEEVNEMLHSVLFRGLRTSLKALSGHKFDAIQDFNTLRIALRQIEKDHELRQSFSKTHTAKAAVAVAEASGHTSDMEEVNGLIQQLSTRMDRWDTERDRDNRQNTNSYTQNRNSYTQNTNSYRKKPNTDTYKPRWQDKPRQQTTSETTNTYIRETRCYRCGQLGHIKIRCRAILHDTKKPLNGKKSVKQDRH